MNKTPNYKEQIKEMISNHYNVRDEYKDNTVEANKAICVSESLPFAIGVCNVMGDLNIGIMIRTASLLGAREFYIFGRKKYDRRSTVGAENYIPIHFENDLLESDIFNVYNPIFIEQHPKAHHLPLNKWQWRHLFDQMEHPHRPPMFLFGSEATGFSTSSEFVDPFIDPEFMNILADKYAIVEIPQRGVLRSFNVSSSMSIVVYDYVRMHW